MQPRVLFRTHYQVDEPALMEFLVKLCTSPVKSAYNETVAQRLAKEVRAHGKKFNVAAGGYALDLARGLGLVNDQNVWTEKGHLVNLWATIVDGAWDDQLKLMPAERLLHFRLFLEADGAAILYVARHLLRHGKLPNSEDDWNALAKELFGQIYSECLKLAGTTADRVALRREIDRIRTRGYVGKSGPHKMFIHLQTLYRLGLVDRAPTPTARVYLLPEGPAAKGLRILVEEIPDLYTLERFVKDRRIMDFAAKVFQMSDGSDRVDWSYEDLLRLAGPAYREIVATGTPLCPLATLIESVQIDLLVKRSEWLSHATAVALLERAQKDWPGEVRFHVDRKGAPAFLKLSDQVLARHSNRGR